MKIRELIKEFEKHKGEASATWLQDQYPALPDKRLSKLTHLCYQNIEDNYGKETADQMKKFVETEKRPVVVVAEITKSGMKSKRPRAFVDEEACYYSQYELFAASAHMHGFVELFHNLIPRND